MSTFRSSASLRRSPPAPARTVLSTTSDLLLSASVDGGKSGGGGGGIESHPRVGKWYVRNYGMGQRKTVRFLTRKSAPENRFTSVRFRTGSGNASVDDLNFGGGGGGGGGLVVAAGPRVSLYGGANRPAGTSDFSRALKPGSAAQRRREEYDEEEEEEEGEVDLFGGKFKEEEPSKSKAGGEGGLDSIDADRNISTGGLLAHCASHRSDSKLVAIGTEGGTVRICDANSRATLRTFNSAKKSGGGGDRKAIRAVAWLRDGKRVAAGGDDGLVRVWNVGGGMRDGGLGDGGGAELTLRGHGDRVSCVEIAAFRGDEYDRKKKKGSKKRSGSMALDEPSSTWTQLVVSASYDHTIRVWDIETNSESKGEDRCLSIMDHGDPVQALLVLPPFSRNGGRSRGKKAAKLDDMPLLVSAGGTTLKVWNPLNGTCLGTFKTRHAKTITSLCLLDVKDDDDDADGDDNDTSGGRKRHIITGGLDGLLRVHSITNEDIVSGSLPCLHGMELSHPISALALSRDMSRLAIGATSGIVTVHQRRRPASQTAALDERREPRAGTYAYFNRGAHERSRDPDDYLLTHQKKQRLAEYDVLLRKFRYGDALDAVLAKRQPQAVIAVIEELGKRRGLTIALSNRDEESLDAILSFTIRFVDNPLYTPHLIGVAHLLCDIYAPLRGQSAAVDELFDRLGEKVKNECGTQRMLLRLLGQIDFVMSAAEGLGAEE